MFLAHELQLGDLITLETLPQSTESSTIRFDPVIAKVTTEKVGFTYTSFSADLTQINISNQDLQSVIR